MSTARLSRRLWPRITLPLCAYATSVRRVLTVATQRADADPSRQGHAAAERAGRRQDRQKRAVLDVERARRLGCVRHGAGGRVPQHQLAQGICGSDHLACAGAGAKS
jgi:hypothetical protein